jgi:hypothetical protein
MKIGFDADLGMANCLKERSRSLVDGYLVTREIKLAGSQTESSKVELRSSETRKEKEIVNRLDILTKSTRMYLETILAQVKVIQTELKALEENVHAKILEIEDLRKEKEC